MIGMILTLIVPRDGPFRLLFTICETIHILRVTRLMPGEAASPDTQFHSRLRYPLLRPALRHRRRLFRVHIRPILEH